MSIICLPNPSTSFVDGAVTAQTVPTPSNSPVVRWDDLRPPEATDFVDPYADLTTRQLIDLAELSRIEFGPEDVKQASDREEGQRLRQTLQEQGLDVEWLLAQVERVTNHYTQQATDTSKDIEGKTIKLLGYVLPLDNTTSPQTKAKVSDFLLVPFIGACVHVPPPHPNQIISVSLAQAIDDPGLFAQVWLEGTIYSKSSSHELFRVDGEQQVEVSYEMEMLSIIPSTAGQSDAQSFAGLAPGHLPDQSSTASALESTLTRDYYSGYPLWQRIQIQTSALFTQTMVRIQDQGSWYALPLGLLMAFGYGVLHTLGPGHGKAVIVSYFIGKEGSLYRGVMMGIRIAIFHVISAIALVILAHVMLQQTIGDSASIYRIVRLFSYAAIAIIGGWMLRQATIPKHYEFSRNGPQPVGHADDSDALNENARLLYPTLTDQVLMVQDQSGQGRLPTPSSVVRHRVCSCLTCVDQGETGRWLSIAVGAVPCSGALLVMLYGLGNDLLWPSVLMVLAISVGMAMTLSFIGVAAIWGQNRTQQGIRLNFRRHRWWSHWGPILGASVVCLIGLFMFGFTLVTAIANMTS